MKQKAIQITDESIKKFKKKLIQSEKGRRTIEKYVRDVRRLMSYADGRIISQELLIKYKEYLKVEGYKTTSINSYFAAINKYCEIMGCQNIHVKMIKIQKESFVTESEELSKNDYVRLVECAKQEGNIKLALIIETIACTGIRISELQYITVESLKKGMTDIYNKGKVRRILYPTALVGILDEYVIKNDIEKGAVFTTHNGQNMDRSNIWKMMKKLCEKAQVKKEKVYPHNIRHLFARCFYEQKPDIAKLADVLGHSNIETTRIYIKSTGKEHQRVLDDMGMLLV